VLKLSASHHFTAVSPLHITQCHEVLTTLTDANPILGVRRGDKPLVGTIYERWAHIRKQTGGRNTFAVCLDLDFSPNNHGTQFTGSFNVSIGNRPFLLLFISVCAFVVFVILNAAYENPASNPWHALYPIAMIGFAIAVYDTGRMSSEDDIPEIIALLEKSLKLNLTHAKLKQ